MYTFKSKTAEITGYKKYIKRTQNKRYHETQKYRVRPDAPERLGVIVFNATFNNTSDISFVFAGYYHFLHH